VVGDIARAIENEIQPYCDDIVRALLDNLQNRLLERSVKPAILSCFGDIAMSIKREFERYITYVFDVLKQASETVSSTNITDEEDIELIDYINEFCLGIFEAYSGIIHGLVDGDTTQHIESQVRYIIALVTYVANYSKFLHSEQLLKAALGAVGDVIFALGDKVKHDIIRDSTIITFIRQCKSHNDDDIRKVASWVTEQTK